MGFTRRFIDHGPLKQEPLFQSCLQPDITAPFSPKSATRGDVFPAIRVDRIDFYHKGGNLFSFAARRGFTTHHKYASVIQAKKNQPYVTDQSLTAISSFAAGYFRIKENCSLYSGLEAAGVAEVYGRHSCAKEVPPRRIVVLDIEISLARNEDDESPEPDSSKRTPMDRIDLLLLDTNTGLLRFFEAKHFTNGEIRAKGGSVPRIVRQIERYKRQLGNQKIYDEVLAAYRTHVEAINALFAPKVPLPAPTRIDTIPRLLVFGFDSQQQGKLEQELQILKQVHQISAYKIGDISKVDPVTLFQGHPHW